MKFSDTRTPCKIMSRGEGMQKKMTALFSLSLVTGGIGGHTGYAFSLCIGLILLLQAVSIIYLRSLTL